MADKSVKVQVEVITGQAQAALNQVAASTKQTAESLKSLDSAGTTTTSSIQKMGSALSSAGTSMRSAGTQMSLGLTAPIVAAGYAIIETSTKFQTSMELIRTQAGASQEEVDKMTKSVLALSASGQTAQGPQKLADGLYHLESLGLRGAQAMDALKTSAQAADLGIADMEGVTSALGAAIVTGIGGTENMNRAMGLLDATIGQGNMRMNDLVAALSTGILPSAKNFGLTLQDVGAALATLTDNGMRADEAATRLRMTFALMAAPTDKAKSEFKLIGLSAYQLAEDMRKPDGLVTAMKDLKTHLDASGMSATQQAAVLSKAFGGGRSSAAILTLIQQVDRLKTKYDAIGQSADTFSEKVQATHETNYYKMQAALAQIQSTLIDIGGTVMPIFANELSRVARTISALKTFWDGLNPGVKTFLVYFAEFLAIAGPVLVIVGSISSGIGALITVGYALIPVITGIGTALLFLVTNPIGLTILAIAALVTAGILIYKNWDTIKAKAIEIWNAVKDYLGTKLKQIGDAISGTWKSIVTHTVDFFKSIGNAITEGWNAVKKVFETIGKEMVKIWQMEWNLLKTIVIDTIATMLGLVIIALNTFLPGWREKLKMIHDAAIAIWNALKNDTKAIFDAIVKAIEIALAAVGTFFVAVGVDIKKAWLAIWNPVVDTTKQVFGVISDTVRNTISAISGWISTQLTTAANTIVSVWTRVKNFFEQLWTDIKKIFSGITTTITGAVNTITAKLQPAVNLMNQAKNTVGSVGGAIGGFFNTALTTGKAALGVKDAIITPRGQVITTDPADYLIATKNPQQLVGQGAGTSGGITLNVHFNGTTIGNDGIEEVLRRAIGKLNREATLAAFAGR